MTDLASAVHQFAVSQIREGGVCLCGWLRFNTSREYGSEYTDRKGPRTSLFVLPERVYEELTVEEPDVETPPVDAAIDEGWATVAAPLEFSEPVVSRVIDGVQYIANADDRPAGEVKRADAALTALAAQHLSAGTATGVYIYTTDIATDEGAETVLASEGYGDSVAFVNGFRFIEDLVAGDS